MRYIGCLTVVAAAAALSMSVSACGGSSNPTPTATATSTAATSASKYPYTLTTVHCGPANNWGLALTAITTKGTTTEGMTVACATAMAVADTYRNDPGPKGADHLVRVTVDNTPWVCAQRQGNPNPYVECMNERDPRESAELHS